MKSDFYIDISQTNGLGKPAVSIYLIGCDREVPCPGCHNSEMFNEPLDEPNLLGVEHALQGVISQFISIYGEQNLTVAILGGEPLSKRNRTATHIISRYVKSNYNASMVIVYSWRTLADIKNENIARFLRYVDYGVLGPFDETLYRPNILPASSNQGIYSFKTEFKQRDVILR